MSALGFLAGLGQPDSIQTAADGEGIRELRANAHIHLPPNFSAFATVAEVIELAAEQGIEALGASNYYDYTVYTGFAKHATAAGIFPLFGLEIITLDDALLQAGIKINDPGNPGKFYVCGKGITRFDPLNSEAASLLATIRKNDSERMDAMIQNMNSYLRDHGISLDLTSEAIRATLAERSGVPMDTVFLQERHIAQAFQEALFVHTEPSALPAVLETVFGGPIKGDPSNPATVQGEIRSRLMKAGKPAFVPETFVSFDHAYQLILALGGIPCYPTLADGANPICAFEDPVEELIAGIRERGLCCAELIPIRNSPEVLSRYVLAMRKAGLFVTAGTEHNTPDLIPLTPTCLNGQPIPPDVQAIFTEGTCVLAAHQYLTTQGHPGFVTADGTPNTAYITDDERITAFAQLGSAVLDRFRE